MGCRIRGMGFMVRFLLFFPILSFLLPFEQSRETDPGERAGSDSPDSAAKELAQVFEGWDVRWWLDQREGRRVFIDL
jgi:hypothetical protein